MKKAIPYLILISSVLMICLICFNIGCSKESPQLNPKIITVGTFNMDWFGDKEHSKRTEQDYKNIAEIIKQTKADILALQEIENASALKHLTKYLPGYNYFVGKLGDHQNCGVLWSKDIELKIVGEYTPLIVEQYKSRPGLVLKAKKGNLDFIMMVVHFKSSSHFDNTEQSQQEDKMMRLEQSKIAAHWADSILTSKRTKEKDIIIAGDFNDSPLRKNEPTLTPLMEDTALDFLTADLKGCEFQNSYVIDNIIVSKNLRNRYIPYSARVFDFFSSLPKYETEKISDHCPVLVEFEVTSPDND
jgi:exonuclease III